MRLKKSMTFSLTLLPRAQQEISDAVEWYERRREGLGEEFFVEFENEIQRIVDDPLFFPQSDEIETPYRRAVLKKFPFIIIFSSIKEEIIIHFSLPHEA